MFRSIYDRFITFLFFWTAARMWRIGWAYADDDGECRAFVMADDEQLLDLLLRDGVR